MATLKGQRVAYCKIYPGIGFSRVGNSPDDFFMGPEAPGWAGIRTAGYRDGNGLMKRQAARFRVYAMNERDEVIQEVTTDPKEGIEIEWEVHLANKKGAWYYFTGQYNQAIGKLHNAGPEHGVQDGPEYYANPDLRTKLIIDPGPRRISGRDQSGARFDDGEFLGMEVPLGELRTDGAGRLLVLGGHGAAASVNGTPITYATANNNPTWWDDTSDGPVRARVRFEGEDHALEAVSSWVLVVPPNFAPFTNSVVTLYDLMRDVFVTDLEAEAADVEFYRDIFPLLFRVSQLPWVNQNAFAGHGPGKGGDFQLLQVPLSFSGASSAKLRQSIFQRVRAPARFATPAERYEQANSSYMPYLWGNWFQPSPGDPPDPRQWMTVTDSMYVKLKAWAEGQFTPGVQEFSVPFDKIPESDRPAALDRASLEPAVGGPFAPGIEITYISANRELYSEPFRFNDRLLPGDITKFMSLPWQNDFARCNTAWWPAQRPDCVLPAEAYSGNPLEPAAEPPPTSCPPPTTSGPEGPPEPAGFRRWARGLPADSSPECACVPGDLDIAGSDPQSGESRPKDPVDRFSEAMVESWSKLGFVLPEPARYPAQSDPEKEDPVTVAGGFVYLEKERTLDDGD